MKPRLPDLLNPYHGIRSLRPDLAPLGPAQDHQDQADDDGALVNPYPAERAAYHRSWREGWRAGARVIIAERERDAALLRAAELQAKLFALEARHGTHDNNPDRSDP